MRGWAVGGWGGDEGEVGRRMGVGSGGMVDEVGGMGGGRRWESCGLSGGGAEKISGC